MFEQQQNTQDESYVDDFTDDEMNIKFANFASEAYVAPNDRRMNLLGYTYVQQSFFQYESVYLC